MNYVKCMDYDNEDRFPYCVDGIIRYKICNQTLYECWQPDCIEDDEFNLVILLDGVPVLVRSCHFDFV